MITVQNSDLNEGIKRTKNGKYVDKYKKKVFLILIIYLKVTVCLKQK